MDTHYISISEILIDESRFSLRHYLFEPFNAPTCHITSFDSLGILYPVVLYEDSRKRLHLVDGRKRVQFAREMKEPMIKATVLPEGTPMTDIITLIFCNRRNTIESSTINRVQFLCFVMSLNVSESWILQSLCLPFEFKPHSSFLQECERIYRLPLSLRMFFHEKKFSFKQMLNLTSYSREMLGLLVQWMSSLQFTASVMDEIASNLRDYLKRTNRPLRDFISESGVQEIFDSSLSARDKTEKIRELLMLRRYPILSEKNAAIERHVEALQLPQDIHLDWDRTLENKYLNLSVNIHDPSKWQALLKTLISEDVKKAIEEILEEL